MPDVDVGVGLLVGWLVAPVVGAPPPPPPPQAASRAVSARAAESA
ncbi:hypothetical protein [Acidithiobacillus sp.]|nr:hypothetical protein [Acidithiobacillus sp.]